MVAYLNDRDLRHNSLVQIMFLTTCFSPTDIGSEAFSYKEGPSLYIFTFHVMTTNTSYIMSRSSLKKKSEEYTIFWIDILI